MPLACTSGAGALWGDRVARFGTGVVTKVGTSVSTASPTGLDGSIAFGGTSADTFNSSGVPAGLVAAGAFTMEAWVLFNVLGGIKAVMSADGGTSGPAENGVFAYVRASGTVATLSFSFMDSASTNSVVQGATSLSTGVWYHVAAAHNGTTARLWLNGVSEGSLAASLYVPSAISNLYLGSNAGVKFLNGNISNARWVSSDVYGVGNSTITVPTSPLQVIPKTRFLYRGPYDTRYLTS